MKLETRAGRSPLASLRACQCHPENFCAHRDRRGGVPPLMGHAGAGGGAVLGASWGCEFALAREPFGDFYFVTVEEAGGDLGDDVVPGVFGGPGDAAADFVAFVAGEGGDRLGGVALIFGEMFFEVVLDA